MKLKWNLREDREAREVREDKKDGEDRKGKTDKKAGSMGAGSRQKADRQVSREEVEARIERVLSAYRGMEQLIDSLPDKVAPPFVKVTVKKMLLDNKKVKDFLYALEHRRPPRFMIVGRTGVGKSSLINALLGTYAAQTSAVEIGTRGVVRHEYRQEGKTVIEVLDTRGVGESFGDRETGADSAERALGNAIRVFAPDAVLFVLPCAGRDRLNHDASVVSRILKSYEKQYHGKLPVFVILNRADEVEPAQEREGKAFSERKLANIKKAVEQAERVLTGQNLEFTDIRAVSSYIDWGYPPEEIEQMGQEERERLTMVYDGRYQIEALKKVLIDNLDVEAGMGLALVGQAEEVLNRLALEVVGVFTLAAGSVPVKGEMIPAGDSAALTTLQAIMVLFISLIGGIRLSFFQACEYLMGFGGTFFSGRLFKVTARFMSKGASFMIARFFPVIPQRISELFINCGVAGGGTAIIGIASVRHFVQGISITKVKTEIRVMLAKKRGQVQEKREKNLEQRELNRERRALKREQKETKEEKKEERKKEREEGREEGREEEERIREEQNKESPEIGRRKQKKWKEKLMRAGKEQKEVGTKDTEISDTRINDTKINDIEIDDTEGEQ